jgi:hypothetical protein
MLIDVSPHAERGMDKTIVRERERIRLEHHCEAKDRDSPDLWAVCI